MRSIGSVTISSFLFISTALAGHHLPRSLDNVEQSTNGTMDGVHYNDQYAGAYLVEDNGTFSTVIGTFTVPNASGENGSGAFIWLGIDGVNCINTALMAGVDIWVDGNEIIYKAWCEFYPGVPHFFDLVISPGDKITISVTAISATSGAVIVHNLSTGQEDVRELSSTFPLCQRDALWFIYRAGKPLVNFGTLTYTDATAYGLPGTYHPGSNGVIIADIRENGQTLTSSSIDGSSVTIHCV